MNWLDYTLLAFLIAFVIEGIVKGFSRQVIGLIAVILGILLGIWFYGTAGSFLLPYVSSPSIAKFIGFLIVFVGVQIVGGLAGWGLSKIFKATGLGWLDRLLGGCFGLLKAALVAVAFVLALTAFPVKPIPDSISRSRLAPYVLDTAHVLTYLAPRDLRDGFVATYEKLREFWIQHAPKTGNKLPVTQV